MKTIFFCSLLFISFHHSNFYIIIEHIGYSDSPICPIILRTSKILSDEYNHQITYKFANDFELKKKTFYKIKDSIIDFKGQLTPLSGKHEYGTFKISIYSGDMIVIQYKVNRGEALQLLPQLIDSIENDDGNNDLVNLLKSNFNRINF